MGAFFSESKSFPKELRAMGHYRGFGDTNAGDSIVGALAAVSPWNFLTGIFVDKPKAEAAAAVAEAQLQAQAISAQQAATQKTLRTVAIVGAGLAGLVLMVVALKPKSQPKVAGYRRKRSRR